MKRDMDKIRAVMLALEADPKPYHLILNPPLLGGTENAQEMTEYILMLASGGLLEKSDRIYRISWAGHEFLDSVRDPEIWQKTKEGAGKVGSWSVKLLGELAIGFARAKAHQLGIPIV